MRLRWPTRSAGQMRSSVTEMRASRRPHRWLSCSRLRLASNSCATLVWRIGPPVRKQGVDGRAVRCAAQGFSEAPLAEHLGKFGKELQMLLVGLLWHQQHEQQADGFAIRGVELHRGGEAEEGAGGLLKTLDAAVGNGDALAQTRGTQAFPGEQAIEHDAAADA